jgi:hypothetical protein
VLVAAGKRLASTNELDSVAPIWRRDGRYFPAGGLETIYSLTVIPLPLMPDAPAPILPAGASFNASSIKIL